MSVVRDIVAAHGKPSQVMKRHLTSGAGEERALIFVMGACVMFFVANLPVRAREAHLEGIDLGPLLGGSIMAWLFLAPLVMYLLAMLIRLGMYVFGCKAGWFQVRLAFFWSLLASTPLALLNGLTGGMVGPGIQYQAVGAIWFGFFLWIIFGSLRAVCKEA